jgi:mono/diheme cytochrome c family protein
MGERRSLATAKDRLVRASLVISIAALASAVAGGVPVVPGVSATQESSQIAQGRSHYLEVCQRCHGADGKRGEGFHTPIWGQGAMIGPKFGNARAMIDYMQLMPFDNPSLLDDAQKLAVVAFILANHGAIKPTDTINPSKAASIPIR